MDDGDDSWQRQLAGTIAVDEDAKPKAVKKVRSRLNSTSSKSSSKNSSSQPDSPFKTPAVPTFNQDSKNNQVTAGGPGKQINTTVRRAKQIPKHDYEATMLLGEANRLAAMHTMRNVNQSGQAAPAPRPNSPWTRAHAPHSPQSPPMPSPPC